MLDTDRRGSGGWPLPGALRGFVTMGTRRHWVPRAWGDGRDQCLWTPSPAAARVRDPYGERSPRGAQGSWRTGRRAVTPLRLLVALGDMFSDVVGDGGGQQCRQKAGETGLEGVAPQLHIAARALLAGLRDTRLAQHLEMMTERGL